MTKEERSEYNRAWYLENREKVLAASKAAYLRDPHGNYVKRRAWAVAHPERTRAYARKWAKEHLNEFRAECFRAYGGACECCGQTQPAFLTLDHIDGRGAEHRKTMNGGSRGGGGTAIYNWLKQRGYPKDNFRLLCFDCNCSRGLRGFCPHEAMQSLAGEA